MSESVAERIAEFATSARLSDFAAESVHEAKIRILDSIGLMIGSVDAPPVVATRRLLERWPVDRGATVVGGSFRVAPHEAAFVNGIMVRYLDFNDTYLSKEAIHPSDMIPALIAAAECFDASGEDLLRSVLVAYEVACALADAVTIRDRGFDHVPNIAIGTAAGVASLLELDTDRTHEAINLATVNAVALRQTRAGELSMWKGCAAPYAARHGLYSTLLAAEGMTGPKPIFEGEMGYMRAVSGTFTLPKITSNATRILKTSIKWWPVEYHSMSAVEAATKIVSEAGKIKPSEVEKISIKTFRTSYNIIVKDPEKWRPSSRETADHSLPYVTIRALLDGDIWLQSFEPEKLRDIAFYELADKTTIEVDPKYDELYPEGVPNRIEVTLKGGQRFSAEILYPKGHYRSPLTIDELRLKLRRLAGGRLSDEALETLWELTLGMDRLDSLKAFATILARI
ncbi:MAG: MmgE/PrpD family protein [Nitrososphaerota archaeon]|nr:MmgE/PrpD family protein [Candidatus Calditenuaceae archaeon]MDW8072742.1 MmgE/PrpD family protein [Nitrososphaerota archaeon]